MYIRTRDVLTADNVSRNLLGRVGFEPDGESDSFNMEKYEYVAVLDSKDLMTLEETGDMEDVRLSISVQVLREEMEHAAAYTVPLTADAGWGRNWAEAHGT